MTINLVLPQYIIVLGTTYSGSGAVYDYLKGRDDLFDPLKGVEYQLPHMPNGLLSLEAVSGRGFHPPTADYILSQFEIITEKLARPKTYWRYGRSYSNNLPEFKSAIKDFINEITATNISMRLNWHRLFESPFKYIFNQLKNYTGIKVAVPKTRILVSQDKLISASQKLHDKIFKTDPDKRPILLNQAGSGWNPVESTKYFPNNKLVLVTRDPRDQFLEIKKYKKAIFVEEFINWYKEMLKRLDQFKDKNLLKITFEDFVYNNKNMIEVLCNHLSISSATFSKYQVDESKKNIGIYKEFLKKDELSQIEHHLSEFFFNK